jgi:hypothetical protein
LLHLAPRRPCTAAAAAAAHARERWRWTHAVHAGRHASPCGRRGSGSRALRNPTPASRGHHSGTGSGGHHHATAAGTTVNARTASTGSVGALSTVHKTQVHAAATYALANNGVLIFHHVQDSTAGTSQPTLGVP